jgi:hypothetical protein
MNLSWLHIPAISTIIIGAIGTAPFTAAEAAMTHIKSPMTGMHFTQGIPIRIVADGIDENGWQGLEGQMESQEVRFFVDGTQVAADDHTRGYNHFEAVVTGLNIGTHTLKTHSLNYGGVLADSDPVVITIDAMPAKTNTISLDADLQLSGLQNLYWQDAIVKGNGHKVTSASNWTGSVIIRNSLITGLAVAGDVIPDSVNSLTPGIEVTTSGGSVAIENSIFEWTGADYLTVNGSGTITIKHNEFRANAFIGYVSWNPGRSPFMQLKGNCTGRKVFAGNNVGAGFLYIIGMSKWLIGGDSDVETNVFIGPRMGTSIENASGDTLRGNYMHHDYNGGWSQGYCCQFQNASNMLVEHTIVRSGSWPVQSMGGEFRYNFVEECGHEWVRTLMTNTSFHHNILHHGTGTGGDPSAGIWIYGNQTGIEIFNNTLWATIDFPAISVSNGSSVSSLRNNLFCKFTTPADFGIVDRYQEPYSKETDSNPRILYADYNCFYNPGSKGPNNYADRLVAGVTEGSAGWGGHDLGGVNGQADPKLIGDSTILYSVDEPAVWNRTLKLSYILGKLRQEFTPSAGSPLIDKGDTADGAGIDIGAVGAGANDPADLFGKFGGPVKIVANPSGSMKAARKAPLTIAEAVFDLRGRLVGRSVRQESLKRIGVLIALDRDRYHTIAMMHSSNR